MYIYAFVFVATLVTDWLWAYYISNTALKNVWKSTLSSGMIISVNAFVFTSYIDNKATIIPAVLGGMLGTWLYVRNTKKKE
jgi:hypothetical protein